MVLKVKIMPITNENKRDAMRNKCLRLGAGAWQREKLVQDNICFIKELLIPGNADAYLR